MGCLTAAASLDLVVSHSPHGLEEIHRLLSSSIIGASGGDVWTFGTLAAVTAVGLAVTHQRLLLLAIDPAMAAAVGLRVRRWTVLNSAWLGLVVGLSIRSSGMLYTFGCLVLPALVAKNVCREVRPMFLVAPVVAAAPRRSHLSLANAYRSTRADDRGPALPRAHGRLGGAQMAPRSQVGLGAKRALLGNALEWPHGAGPLRSYRRTSWW